MVLSGRMSLAAAQRTIPLLDLRAQHRGIRGEVLAAIQRVGDSQTFILGEEVEHLEREIAAYCASAFAVGCASGSDALLLALLAAGIGHGDQVLTSPYSFFATAGAIALVGAEPVFADVERASFNLDVAQVETAVARHFRIRALIPVHLFVVCDDVDSE